MPMIKQLAQEFLSSRYEMRDSLFESAWGAFSHQSQIVSASPAGHAPSRQLAAIGDEDREDMLGVFLFVQASKLVGTEAPIEEITTALNSIAVQYQNAAKTNLEIVERIGALEKVVSAFMEFASTSGRLQETSHSTSAADDHIHLVHVISNVPDVSSGDISKSSFAELRPKLSETPLSIIDEGEFSSGALGIVYFSGNMISPRLQTRPTDITSELNVRSKGLLTPTQYRILVHALRHDGIAGSNEQIAESCWRDKKYLLKSLKREGAASAAGESTRRDYHYAAKAIRRQASPLNKILKHWLGVSFESRKTGIYCLDPVPSFCLVEPSKYGS